jgi:hypothetical protein
MSNLVADRLSVNKLALQVPAWVALAIARLTEVPGHLGVPSSFAVCAAMLAFGDELLVQPDDEYEWRTPGGRKLAAAYLLPLAEAALRPRCSGWPTRLVAFPGQRLTHSSRAEERERAASDLALLFLSPLSLSPLSLSTYLSVYLTSSCCCSLSGASNLARSARSGSQDKRHDRVEGVRSITAALGRFSTLTSPDFSYRHRR